MKISLFSQSLFALPLLKAIDAMKEIGCSSMELACHPQHLDCKTAREKPGEIAGYIRKAGIEVSALSLFNKFTDSASLDQEVESAELYISLAPLFQTKIVKVTPGPPSSKDATERNWQCLAEAVNRLMPVAKKAGVKLAFETHLRHLTDTVASSRRLLDMTPPESVGLTVDFLNLAFAGEKMADVVAVLKNRMFHTHLKNGYIDSEGTWIFQALDKGLVHYPEVIRLLRDAGYTGYLSVECLGAESETQPVQTAMKDMQILKRYLREINEK